MGGSVVYRLTEMNLMHLCLADAEAEADKLDERDQST